MPALMPRVYYIYICMPNTVCALCVGACVMMSVLVHVDRPIVDRGSVAYCDCRCCGSECMHVMGMCVGHTLFIAVLMPECHVVCALMPYMVSTLYGIGHTSITQWMHACHCARLDVCGRNMWLWVYTCLKVYMCAFCECSVCATACLHVVCLHCWKMGV